MPTGVQDLDDLTDGEAVGANTVDMSIVEHGTLSALLVAHVETSNLELFPEWQVSLGDGDWYPSVSAINGATIEVLPVAYTADVNSIAMSTAGVVADDDAIVTSFATSASPVTKSGAGLNGVVGATAMSHPRSITITTAANTGSYNIVDPILVSGLDVDGNATSGNGTLTNADGGETIEIFAGLDGVDGFASVTSVVFPAQIDAGGHFKVGVDYEALSLTALSGKYGDQAISPVATVTVKTASSVGSYNTGDILLVGLDEDGLSQQESLTITQANGNETLTTSGLWSQVQAVAIPAMVNTSSSFQVGTSASTLADVVRVLPAQSAVYGWPYARLSLRIGSADGGASDSYSVSYNFLRKHSS